MPKSQQPTGGVDIIINKIMSLPSKKILDIGIGLDCKWGKLFNGKVDLLEGVEAWPANMKDTHLYYDKAYNCSIIDFEFDIRYDIAILGDVLEHLEYEEALVVIDNIRANVDFIFLIIPVTVCIQDGTVYGNPYETHRYHWSDLELRKLGFELLHVGSNENNLVAIGSYIMETSK